MKHEKESNKKEKKDKGKEEIKEFTEKWKVPHLRGS